MKAKHLAQAARLCTLLASILLLTIVATAQVEQGRFVGLIVDPQGASVSGASVRVTNVGTGIVQAAVTDGSGNFVITPVQAGIYSLSVTAKGFETTTSSNIEVQVGQVVRENLSLRIGAANVTVEVTTTQPLLSTDSATVGQVISNQQLTDFELGLLGRYSVFHLGG